MGYISKDFSSAVKAVFEAAPIAPLPSKSKFISEDFVSQVNAVISPETAPIAENFEELVSVVEEYKVGDKVKPTVGPHAGHPHEVIAKVEGGYNIKPIGLSARQTKYKLGAAKATHAQLSMCEDVEPVDENIKPITPQAKAYYKKHKWTLNSNIPGMHADIKQEVEKLNKTKNKEQKENTEPTLEELETELQESQVRASQIADMIAAKRAAKKDDYDFSDIKSPAEKRAEKGGMVHTSGTYGKTHLPADDDADSVAQAQAAAPKRGRGRPRKVA